MASAQFWLCANQLWSRYAQLVAEAGGAEKVGWWLKPTTTPAMMLTVLPHLQQCYGGILPYLQQAGVAATTLAQVQAGLR